MTYGSTDPQIIGANSDLLRMCIEDKSWAMVEQLTEDWAPEFKQSVWRLLAPEEKKAINQLKVNG